MRISSARGVYNMFIGDCKREKGGGGGRGGELNRFSSKSKRLTEGF